MLLKIYLHSRIQFVDINGTSSLLLPMDIGVPQASILGPLLRPKLFNNVTEVEYVAKFKFLGILIDETLSWKCYVDYMHKKVYQYVES